MSKLCLSKETISLGNNDVDVTIWYPTKDGVNQRDPLLPVLYYIHGGAWHFHNKQITAEMAQIIGSENIVFVAASYRLSSFCNFHTEIVIISVLVLIMLLTIISHNYYQLSSVWLLALPLILLELYVHYNGSNTPKWFHPYHIEDVARNLKWIYNNINKYNGDYNKIVVMGHSAGAHLATLLSTNLFFLHQQHLPNNVIKGCIGISGIYTDKRLSQFWYGMLLRNSVFGSSGVYYDSFPIYNVGSYTPPTLLLSADNEMGLKRQTYDYHYTLKQKGVWVRTIHVPNTSHWNIHKNWHSKNKRFSVLSEIKQFVNEVTVMP